MSGPGTGIASSAVGSPPGLAARVWCDERELYVELTDGRLVRHELPDFVLAVPVDRRGESVVDDDGTEIWWPLLDDVIGVNWLFGVSEDVIDDLAGFEKRPLPEDAEL